jgi:hypothetical protein
MLLLELFLVLDRVEELCEEAGRAEMAVPINARTRAHFM